MPGARDLSRWLAEARDLLAEMYGPQTDPLEVTVRNERTGVKLCLTAPIQERTAATASLSMLERDIVAAVRAAGQLTAKAIAARIKSPNSSGFRAILANLTERDPPVLVSSGHGYRLAATKGDQGSALGG